MKRITPEEVITAYKETGLKPGFLCWALKTEEGTLAHALVAIAVHKGYKPEDVEIHPNFKNFMGYFDDATEDYLEGFLDGFDGIGYVATFPQFSEDFKQGWIDGNKAREEVKKQKEALKTLH